MYATLILFALSVCLGERAEIPPPRLGILPGEVPTEVSPFPTVPVPKKEKP